MAGRKVVMGETSTRGRVLVIDDREANRYIFRRILTRARFTVEEAATGSEGLAMAMSAPDIVILDVNLPDMLGYEVCRRLKSNPVTQSTPVLQISASFVSDESKVQALEEGADLYLTQPVDPTVLVAQVNSLMRLRKAESLFRLSALQWQSTFDAMSAGVALIDGAGSLIRANAALMRLLNLVSPDLRSLRLDELIREKFFLSPQEFFDRVGNSRAWETAFENRWFRIRFDAIPSDVSSERSSILVVNDITAQRKLEEMLKLSERLAATGRLAHIIAHEINNPLAAMSNLLYLASNATTEQPETHSYIEQASLELLRISRITKQVLAYHRDSSHPTPTPADEIVEGVLAIFASQVNKNGIRVDVRLDCKDSIPVHPGEIRQVFSNLIANALDAMEGTRGTLWVRCQKTVSYPAGRPGVRFVFSDSGTGIPEAALPRVFEAFYTTKDSKGSGIGLWLSAEVLGKHRGYMRVRSRTEAPYRGTLFDVFLPLPAEV